MRHAKILEWSTSKEDRIIGPRRGGAMSLPIFFAKSDRLLTCRVYVNNGGGTCRERNSKIRL